MKKISDLSTLFFVIMVFVMITSKLSAQYSGGTGSESNPYQIASLEDLRTLSLSAVDWSRYFILTADINASATEDWNDGKGFSPIGKSDTAFTGSFDGDGFTISGLFINRSSSMYNGLFGNSSGSVFKNLNLSKFNIDGSNFTGCLVGKYRGTDAINTEISNINIINCTIQGGPWLGGLAGGISFASVDNCHVSVTILGGSGMMGGFTGDSNSDELSEIKNCSVTVEFKGLSHVLGGFIGTNYSIIKDCDVFIKADGVINIYGGIGGFAGQNMGTIENCYASGEISVGGIENEWLGGFTGYNNGTLNYCNCSVSLNAENGYYVGGLAGQNQKIIKNCFSSGAVRGNSYVGSLVGLNSANSVITNCYASGSVTGQETIGGLLGENDENTTVSNSYATCLVTGIDITGGFVGENNYFANITDCYASGEVRCETSFSGGFAGLNRSSANTSNCFFDIETSGKTSGIGTDYNAQNQQPVDLRTTEFYNQNIFLDAGWGFGNNDQSPWKMGTAPDSLKRPVLFYHNYLVKFFTEEGGEVRPDSLLVQIVNCGSKTDTITAVPYETYYFAKWQTLSGDSITNVNPLVIESVFSDSSLVAVFRSTYGIEETQTNHVKVYPNPAKDIVNIELEDEFVMHHARVELIDIHGNIIMKINPEFKISQLNIKHFASGFYLFKIQKNKEVIIKRIIIQSE
jgi:hypothetical protein